MSENKDDVALEVLLEIRDTLNRIYICFEDQYLEIQKRKYGEKIEMFKAFSDVRKRTFLFLLDKNYSSQTEIAKAVGISKQAVGQSLKLLIENDLIEQVDENGKIIYRDKYDLLKLLQK